VGTDRAFETCCPASKTGWRVSKNDYEGLGVSNMAGRAAGQRVKYPTVPKEKAAFDYRALAEFRYQIRRFLSFSQQAAQAAGIDPQQHQLLLAIRGLQPGTKPTIRVLAERLQIRHHSAVELVDRCVKRGLVERQRDGVDRRQVTVNLTSKGDKVLAELSMHHRNELRAAGRELVHVLRNLLGDTGHTGNPQDRRDRRDRTGSPRSP
jgi:DNA-binding MarR family transcriptional regulator